MLSRRVLTGRAISHIKRGREIIKAFSRNKMCYEIHLDISMQMQCDLVQNPKKYAELYV